MRKQIVTLNNEEIANCLTIGEWFDKYSFSEKTEMTLQSCNKKLRLLFEAGYLERKDGPSRLHLYRMPEEMKEMLIKSEEVSEKIKSINLANAKSKKPSSKKMKALEAQKKIQNRRDAESILKSAGFI